MNFKTPLLLFIVLFFLFKTSTAQNKNQGSVKIEGYTIYTDKKEKKSGIADINIRVYKLDKLTEKTVELKSKKNGRYELHLDYGSAYKVALEGNEDYMNMSFFLDAKIPVDKQTLNTTISLDFPLVQKDNTDIDTLKFQFPFTKFKFDGNKKFIDDVKYLNDFTKGLFKEYKDAQKLQKKQQADKIAQEKNAGNTHYITIGGKLLSGDPPAYPVINRKVLLKDDKGLTIETAGTDKYGKFSFTKLTPDKNYSVVMEDMDSSGLDGKKITLYSSNGKSLMVSTAGKGGGFKFQLLAADKATLLQLEVEDNSLMLAGTLQATKDGLSQPLPHTKIILSSVNSGQVYETVETDENGNFVFSKLPPDKNFVIRMAEASADLANVKISINDRNKNELASGPADGFGKFRFQFLSGDAQTMNKMQVDERDLKMDLVGKFMDGETNNLLADLKVNLLDDKNTILQTTTTNDKGVFVFKNLELYLGYYFELEMSDPKLAAVKTLVMSEISDKPIKEYKIEAEKPIKHRLLASDQRKLGKLYLR